MILTIRLYTLRTLSLFTIEVQKKDGSKYPPASIYLLLCGLQRVMRRNNRCPFDIFNKKDVRFRGFHGTMESVFQLLYSKGIGAEVKHISLITKEEEATMWEKGVLGDLTLQALVRSVFFLNGKNFWTYSERSRELCEVLGVFNMCIFLQCYNMQFSLYTCRKMFSCEN